MTKFAYFNKTIVPIEQAKISVMTQTFNYGTGSVSYTHLTLPTSDLV